jgi:hypothetical protein
LSVSHACKTVIVISFARGATPRFSEVNIWLADCRHERQSQMFHNLRSTRQTELTEQFPSHVVCDWLGNSEDIAQKHYLQTTDQHFQRALEAAPSSNPVNRTVHRECSALQNPVQSGAVPASSGPYETRENREKGGIPAVFAHTKADGKGFEPPVDFRLQRFSRPPP